MSTTPTKPIVFLDGASYDYGMGRWSQLVGEIFLDWLGPAPGQRWIDIGCGSGAFSDLVLRHCDPAAISGVDPSPGQIEFARGRTRDPRVRFEVGTADALPYPAASADLAVMALVIFFLPDPAAGLAEACRVIRPGGTVAAYAWDIPNRSFPLEPVQAELRAIGNTPSMPPTAAIATPENLAAAWRAAGLTGIEQRTIEVTRRFDDFEDFWRATLGTGSLAAAIADLGTEAAATLKARVQAALPADPDGGVSYAARAHAIAGHVPSA